MSISTELQRIKEAKSAIKSAINAKGGTLTDEQLDQYANAIASLPSGGGSIDLTGVNVTADGLLEGVVAVNGAGQKVTGNIKTVLATLSANVVSVPKGYIADEQELKIPLAHTQTSMSKDGNITTHTLIIDAGYISSKQEWNFTEVGLSGVDVTADKMLSGTVSVDASGQKITGNIPTVTASLENDVVTVPKGYIAEPQTFEVGGGGGSMDFYKCAAVYGPRKVEWIRVSEAGTAAVNGDYEKTSLTTSNGGEVWKHLTANCYLYNLDGYWCINLDNYATWGESAYYYTCNSDLTQWNVGYNWSDELPTGADPAPSVSKIQVTLDADVPKTWDGYKAVLTDGIYDFEKTLTTGMSYGTSYVPVVGGIYSADALVQVSGLFDNIVNNFPGSASLFAIDANVGINDLVGGGAPTLVGSGEVLQNGEFCFDNTRAFDYTIGESMSDLKEFTIEMDYTITSNTTGYCGFFGNKRSWSTMLVCMQWGRSGYRPAMFWNDYFNTTTGGTEHSEWVNDGVYHHVAMVKKGETVTLYSEGKAIATYEGATKSLNLAIENLLAVGTQHVENQIFPGRMKHFRVIGSAIYDGDFDVPEWVGKGDTNSDSGSGDSGDTGGSGDGKTYVYTVSGAGTPGVNGNYYDTGETTKGPVGDDLGYHIYTNDIAKIEFMIDYSQWSISLDGSQKYYIVWDNDAMTTGTTTTVFGDDPAPTISKYTA